MKKIFFFINIVLLSSALLSCSNNDDSHLMGAGSSFIYPIMSIWARDYSNQGNIDVEYAPIGSIGGLQQIISKQVDFASSEIPLSPQDLTQHQLIQFSIAQSGIVPVVNIPGIADDALLLDGELLVDIYSGKILFWDNPAIKKLNPDITLPHLAITTIHRTDASGTTFNFSKYLSEVSPEWRQKYSSNSIIDWPSGIAVAGNDGIANKVLEVSGSIGYVEFSFAVQNNLQRTRLVNAKHEIVSASLSSIKAAASQNPWNIGNGYGLELLSPPEKNAWPIVATSYIILPQKARSAAIEQARYQFFGWSLTQERSTSEELGYVIVPNELYTNFKNVKIGKGI